MNANIQPPRRGDRLSAAWGAGVTEAVNAMRAIGVTGALTREGRTGFGFEPLPENRRVRKPKTGTTGCFYIKGAEMQEKDGQGVTKLTFGNPYFRVAGQLCRLDDEKCEVSLETRSTVALVFASTNGKEAHITYFDEYNSMSEYATDNPDMSIIPLYEIDEEGGVAVDFRNMPVAVQGELPIAIQP